MKTHHHTLPLPTKDELERRDQLSAIIKQTIYSQGPISFENFMSQALYTPKLGYYENPEPFGYDGDFITAAHCGPWLPRMLAKQFIDIAHTIPSFDICEFGAGDGTMALEILLTLEKNNGLPKRYYIIEKSDRLKSIQYSALQSHPHILEKVRWVSMVPNDFSGIIFANEVLDAMPFSIFKKNNQHDYQECFIDIINNELMMTWLPTQHTIPESIQHLNLEDGHCFEMNLHFQNWLKEMYQSCDQAICLLLDYGMEERSYFSRSKQGYARAFYKHRVHDDLLQWPGLQDLTTHVNFTDVARAAYAIGWTIEGYTTQANFLLDCGISHVELPSYESAEGILARAQIKKLLLPQEMGEMFKVLALGKKYTSDLIGFQNELSNRL